MKGKPFKRLCAMGLSALMLMGAGVAEAGSLIGTSITVSAAAVTPDGSFRYVENANGITIKKFIGSETEAIIPEKIDGKKVTEIGDRAFYQCDSLKSVTIPNSVTSIGYCAFYQCYNLISITIPKSVTSIGSCAFVWCYRLSSVTIPNSVISIGNNAFYGCGITNISFQKVLKA